MENIKELVLNARENRIINLKKVMKNRNVYIILKANIPGEHKRTNIGKFLVNLFQKRFFDVFIIENEYFYDDFDGIYAIFEIFSSDIVSVKKRTVIIEDTTELGRYIDIDVYQNDTISISRNDLGLPLRKCFVCDNDAFYCIRKQNHSFEEINKKIVSDVYGYIENIITIIAHESMLLELDLDPKFGLVTKKSNGSHGDMNYELMKNSIDVIAPYFGLMAVAGFSNEIDDIQKVIKEIGIISEKNMFIKTNGVNTHKGLIFNLGYASAAIGYLLNKRFNEIDFSSFSHVVSNIGKDLINDFDENNDTFGYYAYKEYGITGARGEIFQGFPSVKEGLNVLDRYEIMNNEALLMTLIKEIICSYDTCLLKRSKSIDKYNEYKNLICSIDKYDIEKINEITNHCIKEGISFGGAADLLVVTIFIKKVFMMVKN